MQILWIIILHMLSKFVNIVVSSFSTQRLHQLQQQVEQLKEENYAMETCK